MATYDLCTLDQVRDYGELKGLTAQDEDVIEDLITRVTTLFENYVNKKIKSREFTEYYDGHGEYNLVTNQYPIISIDSIKDDVNWEWGSDTTVGSTDYRIHTDKTYVVLQTTLQNAIQNVKIVYTAGYATIPTDIVQACIEEVLRKYRHRTDFDVTAMSQENGSVTYTEKGLLTGTKAILDKYKRVGLY